MRTRPRLLFLLGPLFALALLLWAHQHGRADSGSAAEPAPAPKTPAPPAPKPAAPQVVTVGLYLQNIPEIDIKTNSFTAEFYLWFLWKGDIDPTLTYELTNAVNVARAVARSRSSPTRTGNSRPEMLPDGRQPAAVPRLRPLRPPVPARQVSVRQPRHRDLDRGRQASDRRAGARGGHEGHGDAPRLTIPGWTLSARARRGDQPQFATNFGDPRTGHERRRATRASTSRVHIDRPVVGIVSKTVIPIAIIILITFGAFFCQPQDIDARLCLTITALISAVALQFTAATELPPTGSLLLARQDLHPQLRGDPRGHILLHRRQPLRPHGASASARAQVDRWGLWLVAGRLLRRARAARHLGASLMRCNLRRRLVARRRGRPRGARRRPPPPRKIVVGTYINHVFGVDIKNSQFTVDFYVWFRWEGDDLKPLDTFELANGRITSKSGIVKKKLGTQNYASCRVLATITKFWDLRRFPLDNHTLSWRSRTREQDDRAVVYEADRDNSGISPDLQVPGWVVKQHRGRGGAAGLSHQLRRHLAAARTGSRRYSRYLFSVDVARPGYGRFLKVFFGLFISVLISWCGFFVRPKESSPRVSLGVGATFAAAAVTVAINNSLPDTNAVTMADKLIMLTLGIIVASVAETITALTLFARGKETAQQKLDRICSVAVPRGLPGDARADRRADTSRTAA